MGDFFFKKILCFFLFFSYFLPVGTMHVLESENVVAGRVVLEEIPEDERASTPKKQCSLWGAFSRLAAVVKQCFSKKYDATPVGRCVAFADTLTAQYIGAFVGVQIAQYFLLDPSVMMVLGGLLASTINDYWLSEGNLNDTLGSKWLITYGLGFANIFCSYPLKQAVMFVHPRLFLDYGPSIGSIDSLCHFLSHQAQLLNAMVFIFECDVLANFVESGKVEPQKYVTVEQLPKTLALLSSGFLGQEMLYELMGRYFILCVMFGGQILSSLHAIEDRNFVHTPPEPKFKMIQNAVANSKSCPICLEDFEKDAPVALISCAHVFHQTCLSAWKKQCPLDKKAIDGDKDFLLVIFAIPIEETIEKENKKIEEKSDEMRNIKALA